MYQMYVYINIQCGIHWLCAHPVQVHHVHASLCAYKLANCLRQPL